MKLSLGFLGCLEHILSNLKPAKYKKSTQYTRHACEKGWIAELFFYVVSKSVFKC